MTYAITTYHGERRTSRRKALSHLTRRSWSMHHLADDITAPRGSKTPLIEQARQIRRIEMGSDPLTQSVEQRVRSRLLQDGLSEIRRRVLSTPAGWDTVLTPRVVDRVPGMWLIHAEGWYKYSRRAGSWYLSASYLCGRDNDRMWAVRVPSTEWSVRGALGWLTPGPVRTALANRKPVRRQGDIYFVGRTRGQDDFDELAGTRHEARTHAQGGYTIVHLEHTPVRLSGKYRWRAYAQRQLDGSSRTDAD